MPNLNRVDQAFILAPFGAEVDLLHCALSIASARQAGASMEFNVQNLKIIVHVTLLASLLALSHVILKSASLHGGGSVFRIFISQWYKIGPALAIYGFVFFYYVLVLQKYPLSVVYPAYTALSLVLVLVSSAVMFNESINAYQFAGITLAIISVFLLTRA